MLNYVIRRLILMVPTLMGITLVVFGVMYCSPGGVGGSLLNDQGNMRPEEAKAMREYYVERYGLGKPFLEQYFTWLNHVLPIGFVKVESPVGESQNGAAKTTVKHWRFKLIKMPELGTSFSKGRPVLDLIAEALPITVLLNVITIPLTYVVSVVSGIRGARHRGGMADRTTSLLFLALWSVPSILGGVLLVGFLSSKEYAQLFPTGGLHATLESRMSFLPWHSGDGWRGGWLLDTCWHLVLPVATLTYGGFAFQTRLVKSTMLENMGSDYARTARAKGLGDGVVVYRHVFRNSLIPLITSSASLIPALLGGSLIVERIYSLQGMGSLMIDAINLKDRELILANTLIVGGLGLLSYLVSDLLYVVADPRVSFE